MVNEQDIQIFKEVGERWVEKAEQGSLVDAVTYKDMLKGATYFLGQLACAHNQTQEHREIITFWQTFNSQFNTIIYNKSM